MIILEDTRNQVGKHDLKAEYFENNGIEIRRTKLYVGDYTLPTNQSICIDTKKDIQELIGDICGKQHERLRAELLRAQESGIKLIILVEDDGGYCDYKKTIYNKPVTCLDDLFRWKNPRLFIWRNGKQLYPSATKGAVLAKACITMRDKYGVDFQFCRKVDAGKRIIELLTPTNGAIDEEKLRREKYGAAIYKGGGE
jgi:ribosome-associated protein